MAYADQWRLWLRDFVDNGVPSSGINEPEKAEGRAVFTAIGAAIEGILQAFAVGSMVPYPSVAAMTADLANQDVGTYAIILSNDADSLKIYLRGASAWGYVTTLSVNDLASLIADLETAQSDIADLQADVTALESDVIELQADVTSAQGDIATAQANITLISTSEQIVALGFNGKVRVDPNGMLGQVRTIFLSRQFAYKRDGVSVSLTNMGTESTRFPGTTEVQYASNSTLYVCYLDVDDTSVPFKLLAFGSAALARDATLIPLFTIWGGIIQERHVDVEYIEDAVPSVFVPYPVAIEAGNAFIPNAFVGSDTIASFTDRIHYKEMSFAAGATAQQLCWSHVEFLKGNDPWVVNSYPRNPRSSALIPVLRAFNGYYYPIGGVPVVGEVPGGTTRNLMITGKANPELCDIKIGTNVLTDITGSNLLALGFTKGYASPTGSFNHYGCLLADNAPGRWAIVRIYVETDTDNTFGTVTAYFTTPSLSGNSIFTLVREKTLSAREASFVGWAKMPSGAEYTGIWAGSVGGAANVVVCGLQIGYGTPGRSWIRRDDYPTAARSIDRKVYDLLATSDLQADPHLLYPDDLWMIEGRPQTFYPTCTVKERLEGSNLRVSLTSKANPASLTMADVSGEGSIVIDPARLGAQLRMIVRRTLVSQKAIRKYKDVTTHIAPLADISGETIRPLYIGDSITEITGRPAAAKRKLDASGATCTPVGTVDVTETGAAGTVKAEGRSSRRYDEYTGEDQSRTAPIAIGGEAAYLALSTTAKRAYNPFLREDTGGDPPEYIFGGYIFDLSFYLTRFSLATPTHIIINLGTNDLNQLGPEDGAVSVEAGIRCLVARIRDTHPTLPVAFSINQQPRTSAGDVFWAERQVVNILTHLETLADISDANCYLLPGFAHISPDDGWPFDDPEIDAITGEEVITLTDVLHYEGIATEQMAEMEAAWMACLAAGV